MCPKAFAERFLAHLDKIDPGEVENFLRRTVQERDFISRIFDALTEGVVVVDPELRVTLVNPAARRILQWPTQRRLIGEKIIDQLETSPLRDILDDFIKTPRLIQNEEIVLSPRSRKFYNLHLIPISDPDSGESFDAAALILQDLTLAKNKQARDAQAEKLASLFTLTAGVAHEIKNPLNSLSIHAQLLEKTARGMDADKRGGMSRKTALRIMQSCDVIAEEVERLRRCVDDFIEAARPRKPQLEPAALNPIVESVVRGAALEAEERQIRMETQLEPDLPVLMLDEKQVRSALRNLLRNSIEAIEAARRTTGEGRVVLRTGSLGETVALEITDNGGGIQREDMPKLFEPYFTTKFNGSGLGLMAVARIMREHDGLISVKSEAGEGTTFTLEFPVVNRTVKLLDKPSETR
jgi:signal transduction histidine kinase